MPVCQGNAPVSGLGSSSVVTTRDVEIQYLKVRGPVRDVEL